MRGIDKIIWQETASDTFSVRSMYQGLVKEKYSLREEFPYRLIWQGHIPSKVCTFLWIVQHKKILKHDSSKRRGWSFPSKSVLCGSSEEDANHIFITCWFTRKIWDRMQTFVYLKQVPPDITQAIQSWPRRKPACPKDWCTRTFLHALCWSVWSMFTVNNGECRCV